LLHDRPTVRPTGQNGRPRVVGTRFVQLQRRRGLKQQSEAILSAEFYYGNESAVNKLLDSVNNVQGNLLQADSDAAMKEVVVDKC